MKKIISLLCLILISTFITNAQLDSATIIDVISFGGTVADTLRPEPWIKGIDNDFIKVAVTAISSIIIGILHRRRTVRRWKRSGKLND